MKHSFYSEATAANAGFHKGHEKDVFKREQKEQFRKRRTLGMMSFPKHLQLFGGAISS